VKYELNVTMTLCRKMLKVVCSFDCLILLVVVADAQFTTTARPGEFVYS